MCLRKDESRRMEATQNLPRWLFLLILVLRNLLAGVICAQELWVNDASEQ